MHLDRILDVVHVSRECKVDHRYILLESIEITILLVLKDTCLDEERYCLGNRKWESVTSTIQVSAGHITKCRRIY